MYAKNGIHLFRTNLPPDDWLLRLNPQSVVLVGSYEHQDAVLATQAAAAKLVGLLPNAIVKVRWWKDDDILRTISPAGFARLFFPLHVPGTHLGVGNEDAQNADDPRVFAETVRLWCEVVVLATAAGIPLCIGSTPMGTPQYGQYELMIPMWKQFAAARKQGVFHIYTPNAYFPVPADEGAITHLARRHETEMLRVCAVAGIEPPPILYGEYNTVESVSQSDLGPAANGLPVQLWVHGLKAAGVQASTNIYVYGDGLYDQRWIGFNIARCPGYMEAMVNDLPRTPLTFREEYAQSIVQQPEGPPVATPPKTVYAPDYICPNGTAYGVFTTDETMYCRTVDGRQMQWKNELGEQFIVTPQGIERGADWSSLWTPDGQYKGFFYVLYKKKPTHPQDGWGALWVERELTEGEEKTFPCWIVEYWWDGRIKAGPVESPNRIKFLKHYDTYPLPNGATLTDVIELLWRGEEVYAYKKDFGLVLWKNLRDGRTNYLTRGAAGPSKPVIYPIHKPPESWRNHLVPIYPAPESLGDLIAGVVKKVAANYVNIRSLPSANATKMGELRTGDPVQYREPVIEAGAYVTSSGTQNTWLSVSNGWVAAALITIEPAQPDEVPVVDLRLPFVSQLGTDADLRNNDCGMAAAQALALWRLQQAGFGDMPLLRKVDNLIPVSPLALGDNPVPVGKLREYLTLLGVQHQYSNALTPDAIIQELDKGNPVLVLGNYKYVHAGSKRLGHYWLIKGYTENQFIVNDSYLEGEAHRMTRAALQSALTDLKNEDGTSFASIPFQGIKLDYAA